MLAFLEFAPLLLFFIAYKAFDIFVATAIGILASTLSILFLKHKNIPVPFNQWLTFALILISGALTLTFQDPIFIKFKPTGVYLITAAVLLFGALTNRLFIKKLLGKQITLTERKWKKITFATIAYFVFLAILNLVIAFNFSLDAWVKFKVFGSFIISIVFLIIVSIWIKKDDH